MSGESAEQKAKVTRARSIITERLGSFPSGCDKCKLLNRCEEMPDGLMCELSDEECDIEYASLIDYRAGHRINKPLTIGQETLTDEWSVCGSLLPRGLWGK